MIFFHYKINHIFLIPKINNYWLIIWLKIIQKEKQKFHKNEVYNIEQMLSENNVMQRVKQCWVLTTADCRAGWGAGVNTFQYVGPLVIIIYIRKQSDRGHTLYSYYYILILIDIGRYQDRRLFLFFLFILHCWCHLFFEVIFIFKANFSVEVILNSDVVFII